MSIALFYPWIDIQDDSWLKTALLYWDSIRTIVPESMDAPYSTETARALEEADFLTPLRVHSGMEEIQELTDDVMAYLCTVEGAGLLLSERSSYCRNIHVDKLPYRLGRLAEIHPEKLPYEIRRMLQKLEARPRHGSEWLHVDEGFADFYMTLLASRLADRVGARLLTSISAADRLAVTARFDARMNGLIPWAMGRHGRPPREYEAFGSRRRMPRNLAPGLLAHLAIERVGIAADTPIDTLLDFREGHRDELARFRTTIEQLASSVEGDLPIEALRQRVADLYTDEVSPAVSDLKAALEGRRIKWLSAGLLKVAFLSAGPSAMLAVAGLDVPTALLAGAGMSLVATGAMYNVEKRESLRANPFSYLLSVEREVS